MIVTHETVFIVDSDLTHCKSMMLLLGSLEHRVEAYESAELFLKNTRQELSGCLVLDQECLELQAELSRQDRPLPFIVVTANPNVGKAVQSMKLGALDYLQKPVREQSLLEAVSLGLKQDRERRRNLERERQYEERWQQLTNREREVMEYVIQGLSSKQIAPRLGVSYKTIETHRANIMKKLEAKCVSQLVSMHLAFGMNSQRFLDDSEETSDDSASDLSTERIDRNHYDCN